MSAILGHMGAIPLRAAPRAKSRSRAAAVAGWGRRFAPWIVPALIVLAWEGAARLGWLSSRILPEPLAVIKAGWTLARSGELFLHVRTSAWRAFSGFAIGGGLGLVLGLVTGSFRRAELLLDTTIQMVRNVPPLALIPLVILWFGIDETAKLFLIAFGVF